MKKLMLRSKVNVEWEENGITNSFGRENKEAEEHLKQTFSVTFGHHLNPKEFAQMIVSVINQNSCSEYKR